MKRDFNFCPRCGDRLPDHPGALSRVDNKTEICSHCGTEEALLDYGLMLESARTDRILK